MKYTQCILEAVLYTGISQLMELVLMETEVSLSALTLLVG